MLTKSKLNSIEKLISKQLIDLEIIHGEYNSIINEGENYRKLKENIRMKSEEILKNKKMKNIKHGSMMDLLKFTKILP